MLIAAQGMSSELGDLPTPHPSLATEDSDTGSAGRIGSVSWKPPLLGTRGPERSTPALPLVTRCCPCPLVSHPVGQVEAATAGGARLPSLSLERNTHTFMTEALATPGQDGRWARAEPSLVKGKREQKCSLTRGRKLSDKSRQEPRDGLHSLALFHVSF